MSQNASRDQRLAWDYDLNDTAPRHSGGLLLSRALTSDWAASLAIYHMAETAWYIDGDLVDEYSRLDLRLAKDFQFTNAAAKVELLAQNLGPEYNEFSLENSFENRVMLRVELQID